MRSLLVAALVAWGVAVRAGAAQAHPGDGGPADASAGMAQMYELMQQGSPGMAELCL